MSSAYGPPIRYPRSTIGSPPIPVFKPVILMPTPSFGIQFAVTMIAASLALFSTASAQPAPAPVRPAPARPVAPAAVRPPAAPGQPPVAAPSSRAAACHNGMNFDRFLADLNQQAV